MERSGPPRVSPFRGGGSPLRTKSRSPSPYLDEFPVRDLPGPLPPVNLPPPRMPSPVLAPPLPLPLHMPESLPVPRAPPLVNMDIKMVDRLETLKFDNDSL